MAAIAGLITIDAYAENSAAEGWRMHLAYTLVFIKKFLSRHKKATFKVAFIFHNLSVYDTYVESRQFFDQSSHYNHQWLF